MTRSNTARPLNLAASPADIPSATQMFLNYCRAKNLSPNTLTYYKDRLASLVRYLDNYRPDVAPDNVTPQLIRTFLLDETQRHSSSTAAHGYIALRAFFNYLARDPCCRCTHRGGG